jgi:hypothetical protein
MKRFAIALLLLCGCHAFSQVTFIGKSKDIYIFKTGETNIQATCAFTNRPTRDDADHDVFDYCPLDIMPGSSISALSCAELPAPNPKWLHHMRNLSVLLNTEDLSVDVEDCTWENQNTEAKSKDEEDWGWTGKVRETIYFKVRSMTK